MCRRSLFVALVLAAFSLGSLIVSCDILPSPDQYRRVRGEHVVAYYRSGIDESGLGAFLDTADDAWLEVLDLTGIPITLEPVVVVDESGPDEIGLLWSSYYQYDTSIHLNDEVFAWDSYELAAVLRHEFTHLAVGLEYGMSESFVLTEGIAVFIESRGEPAGSYWGEAEDIADALGFSYAEVTSMYRDETLDEYELYDLYTLSGVFAGFWIERFGLASWYRLHARFRCDSVRESIEAEREASFQEVCDEFRSYRP